MKITDRSNSQQRKCRHRRKKVKRTNSSDSSVLFIDEDKDLPLPITQKCNSITKPKQNKRQVQLGGQNGTLRDLRVTQNFKIMESEKQCIININTSISRHDTDVITVRRNTSNKVLFSCCPPKQRIVPTCTRKKCEHCYKHIKFQSLGNNLWKTGQKPAKEKLNEMASSSSSKHENKKHSYHNARSKKRLNSLSSISSGPLSDFHEPLSDSSDTDIELDSLIKRTKERIKKTVFEAPDLVQISPTDETSTTYSGDMNISIHSLTTVVLDPIENSAYSPTNSFGFLTDNDESLKNFSVFDNIGYESSSISKESDLDELESISPVINTISPISFLSVESKQVESDMIKASIEQTDDCIIDTACLQQIKKEPNDDMFIVHSNNNNNSDDYILWNDDGLIQDEIKIEEDFF